jgi:hypothetical protein
LSTGLRDLDTRHAIETAALHVLDEATKRMRLEIELEPRAREQSFMSRPANEGPA